jgi:hypothetical protein
MRRQFYESATIQYAYLALLKHMVLSSDSAQCLMVTLTRGSRKDTSDVFSGVICLWLDCMSVQIQSEDIL